MTFLTSLARPRALAALLLGAALPFVLSACNSCADAGLCRVAGDEAQPFA
ncbi:hypothetical protein [Deinococcus hopiensis]|nr:hypothetical protein [Deinococcus hopiensis]